jgi:hypothetical protein
MHPGRPLRADRPDRAGGSVVVGQAPPARRERPGRQPPRTAGRCGPLRSGPGREHDTTCAAYPSPGAARRADRLDRCRATPCSPIWATRASTRLTCPIKNGRGRRADRRSAHHQRCCTPPPARWPNAATRCSRPPSRRLRRVTLCPWRIGAITAAALVLLHHEHDRTT